MNNIVSPLHIGILFYRNFILIGFPIGILGIPVELISTGIPKIPIGNPIRIEFL